MACRFTAAGDNALSAFMIMMETETARLTDLRAGTSIAASVLKLPPSTSMKELNELLQPINLDPLRRSCELLIDMEDVTFILVECLTTIISEVAFRVRSGYLTTFNLPLSRDARGFLRDWEFPKTFRLATGIALMDLVSKDNVQRIHEIDNSIRVQDPRRYGHDRVYSVDGQTLRVPIDSIRFFSFRHWDPIQFRLPDDPTRFKRAVLDESERWVEDSTIRQVLLRQLGEYYSYLPSTVIHEAMSNAFRHGNATSIVAVSKGDLNGQTGRSRFLTLVFWDNGSPSYSTLRRRLDAGQSILGVNAESAPPIHYRVEASESINSGSVLQYSSKKTPTQESTDWELFLATTYPGVTADPFGEQHVHHPALSGESDAAKPGRGLSNLINGAVDVFRGSVAFRAGDYFMNFTRPQTKPNKLGSATSAYRVTIRRTWPFLGNMLTIRLPLRG